MLIFATFKIFFKDCAIYREKNVIVSIFCDLCNHFSVTLDHNLLLAQNTSKVLNISNLVKTCATAD